MITRSTTPRPVAKWTMRFCAFMALGCTQSSGFPPPPTASGIPLPAGVDSDATTFRAHVDTSFPGRANPHRRARAAYCRAGSLDTLRAPRVLCSVDVQIEPLGNTLLIDPDNGPSAPVNVARLENLDSVDTEAKFGLRPGIQAIYYLVVDRRPGSNKARWTLVEVPMGAGIVRAVYQANLNLCHHWHEGDLKMSDADFYEYKYDDHQCERTVGAQTSSVNEASFFSIAPLARLIDRLAPLLHRELMAAQGGWISCSGGCCT
jgi:hypothetical protein